MELEKVIPWHCFSLCSNVIRAHCERHGLDCNLPASLPPSLSDLFAPSLFLSLTRLVPHLYPKLNQSSSPSPFQPHPHQVIGIQLTSLSPPWSLLLICLLVLLTLSVSLWQGICYKFQCFDHHFQPWLFLNAAQIILTGNGVCFDDGRKCTSLGSNRDSNQ